MAGYKGYSMSNNAVSAYEDGEKPLSKWTKTEIIESLPILNADVKYGLKKMTAEQIKREFLYRSSWHHTSKKYNRTNFYSLKDLDKKEVAKIVNEYYEIKAVKSLKNDVNERHFKDGTYLKIEKMLITHRTPIGQVIQSFGMGGAGWKKIITWGPANKGMTHTVSTDADRKKAEYELKKLLNRKY